MLSAGKAGELGLGGNCVRNAIGIPMTPKKTEKPPQIRTENARPVAKIKESNAGGDTEEGQTDHKALSGKPEGSYRRRKFRGSAGQLDKQQR